MNLEAIGSGILWTHYSINDNPAVKKLKSFSDFESGWHYGEGDKFDKKILSNSLDLIIYLYNHLFLDLNVFPGLNGEIMIKAYFPKTAIEITLEKNLEINFMVEDRLGNELFQSDTMSIENFKNQILSQRQSLFEWNGSESYRYIITTIKTKGLQASLSKTPLKSLEGEYPLSLLVAQPNGPGVYVNIFEKNTQSTPILQFTGDLTGEYYPPKLNLF